MEHDHDPRRAGTGSDAARLDTHGVLLCTAYQEGLLLKRRSCHAGSAPTLSGLRVSPSPTKNLLHLPDRRASSFAVTPFHPEDAYATVYVKQRIASVKRSSRTVLPLISGTQSHSKWEPALTHPLAARPVQTFVGRQATDAELLPSDQQSTRRWRISAVSRPQGPSMHPSC